MRAVDFGGVCATRSSPSSQTAGTAAVVLVEASRSDSLEHFLATGSVVATSVACGRSRVTVGLVTGASRRIHRPAVVLLTGPLRTCTNVAGPSRLLARLVLLATSRLVLMNSEGVRVAEASSDIIASRVATVVSVVRPFSGLNRTGRLAPFRVGRSVWL